MATDTYLDEIIKHQEDHVLKATMIPASLLAPSPLRATMHTLHMAEYASQHLKAMLAEPTRRMEEILGYAILAELERIALEEQMVALESRRWSSWMNRQFRRQPGTRFADIMRGVERN